MIMRPRTAFLSGLAFLLCVSTAVSAEAMAWKRDQVAEHEFELVSNQSVDIYHFLSNGEVHRICGIKNGPITGFYSRWKIEGDQLEIMGGLEIPSENFTLLKFEESRVTVRRKSGQEAVFMVFSKR
jgi:hypothetical protein